MEDFVSKIPEDIFEILLDLGIDPVSTTETEDYFYHLVTDYTGDPEAFETYLKKSVERDFKSMSEPPEWLQGSEWQFNNGKPMCFVGQLDTFLQRDGGEYGLTFYVFWDMETGETKTITQSD